MQRYAEGYVKKDYSGARVLPRIGMTALALAAGVLAGIAALFFLGVNTFTWCFSGALVLCSFGLLKFLWRYVDVAYEYTIVEDELRVVKILGDVVRRPMVVIALRTVKEKGSGMPSVLPATVWDAASAPDAQDLGYVLYETSEGEGVLLWNKKEKLLALMPFGKNV